MSSAYSATTPTLQIRNSAGTVIEDVSTARHDGARPIPRPGRPPGLRRRHRDPAGRPDRDREPLPADRGHGAADRGHRPGCGRGEGGRARLHRGGPRYPDIEYQGRYAGRGLHRRAHAGLGRRHAGPDRDVAHARRGGGAAAAWPRRRDHLHRPGDCHRRRLAAGGHRGRGLRPGAQAAAGHQPAGQDGRLSRRFRQGVHQPGHQRRARRRDRGPAATTRCGPSRSPWTGAVTAEHGPTPRRLPVPVRQHHQGHHRLIELPGGP